MFERRRSVLKAGLWFMTVTNGLVAANILLAPRGFYDGFPLGPAEWVSSLPPYNEHLLRDYGAALLGLVVLTALAAIWMERRLVQAALISVALGSLPHLAFHLTETGAMSTTDDVLSLLSLAVQSGLPLALLGLTRDTAPVPSRVATVER